MAGWAHTSQSFFSSSEMAKIVSGQNGKPGFQNDIPACFNISHSGDDIALLISDEGEVGCDIEVIRPRENWQQLANALFSAGEHKEIEAESGDHQLAAFWRIWTRKEAIVKQRGSSVRQMANIDSTQPGLFFLSHCISGDLSMTVCTLTPLRLPISHCAGLRRVNVGSQCVNVPA